MHLAIASSPLSGFKRLFLWTACALLLWSPPVAAAPAAQAPPRLVIQAGHFGRVTAIAWSQDNRLLLSGDASGITIVWHIPTGRELRRFSGQAGVVALALSQDAPRVAIASDARQGGGVSGRLVRVWDHRTGKELARFKPQASVGEVREMYLSPNGKNVIAQGGELAQVWNVATHETFFVSVHPAPIVSPDGSRMLAAVTSGASPSPFFPGLDGGPPPAPSDPYGAPSAFKVAPAAPRLAAYGSGEATDAQRAIPATKRPSAAAGPRWRQTPADDEAVRLWELDSGRLICSFEEPISAAAFSPDSTLLATCSGLPPPPAVDGIEVVAGPTISVWAAADGEWKRAWADGGFGTSSLVFSRDGAYLLSAGGDGAQISDVAEGKQRRLFEGGGSPVVGASLAPDHRSLALVSPTAAEVWDVESGERRAVISPREVAFETARFSATGKRLLTDGSVPTLWSAATGKVEHRFPPPNEYETGTAAMSSGGKYLAAAIENEILICDSDTSGLVQTLRGDTLPLMGGMFSPDGQSILTFSEQAAPVWRLAAGRESARFRCESGFVYALAISPDGQQVLLVDERNTASLWNARDKRTTSLRLPPSPVNAVCFAPDGRSALVALSDGTARLVDLPGGDEMRSFSGHLGRVTAVQFTPDGSRVLTGGADGTLCIWDASTGGLLKRIAHPRAVDAAAFSHDGRQVLVWNPPRLFDVESGRQVRGFSVPPPSRATAERVQYDASGGAMSPSAGPPPAPEAPPIPSFELASDAPPPPSPPPASEAPPPSPDDQPAPDAPVEGDSDEPTGQDAKTKIMAAVSTPAGWKAVSQGKGDDLGFIAVIDMSSKKESCLLQTTDLDSLVVALSADGSRLLTSSQGGAANAWDVATGQRLRHFTGHEGPIYAAALSADGQHGLTAGFGQVAHVWSLASGKQTDVRPERQGSGSGFSPAVSFDQDRVGVAWATYLGDGRKLAIGAIGAVSIWDTSSNRRLTTLGTVLNTLELFSQISADGRRLYAQPFLFGSYSRLIDVSGGRELRRFVARPRPQAPPKRSSGDSGDLFGGFFEALGDAIADSIVGGSPLGGFSPDGKLLLTINQGLTQLWDPASGRELQRLPGLANAFAFSHNSRQLLLARGNAVVIWDIAQRRERMRFMGHAATVRSLSFSRDQRFIVTAGDDQTVRVWDAAGGREYRRFSQANVNGAELSADNQRLLTSDAARPSGVLWDLSANRAIARLNGDVFSPSGRYVLGCDDNGAARIYTAANGAPVCSLISFRDGTWAVSDAWGRFDASNPERMNGLHWVVGDEPVELAPYKRQYYQPGLLRQKLGYSPNRGDPR